jgi:heptosyltransferase-2
VLDPFQLARAALSDPQRHARMFRRFQREPGGPSPRSILVMRPDHLGDFVLGVPFLRALKSGFPGAAVHVVVSRRVAELARRCAWTDSVIVLPDRVEYWGPRQKTPAARTLRRAMFAWRSLSPLRPDLAVLPRVDADGYGAALMMCVAGAAERLSFSESSTPQRARINEGFDAYLTRALPIEAPLHEVAASRRMAEALGCASGNWALEPLATPQERERLRATLSAALPGAQGIAFVAPGANELRRRWPAPRFGEVATRLVAEGLGIALVGDGDDATAAAEIAACLPAGRVVDLTSRLSVPETIAAMQAGSLFVGNDSGAMHMAASAGLPCVQISCFPKDGDPWHANSPTRFGPWGVPHRVLQPSSPLDGCAGTCRADVPHCILTVEAHAVTGAALELLEPARS